MEKLINPEYYDVYEYGGDGEPCELIEAEKDIEVNEFGYKLMGHLPSNGKYYSERVVIYDGEKVTLMSDEQFVNFEREIKLKNILCSDNQE
jgi:hypothetical protein